MGEGEGTDDDIMRFSLHSRDETRVCFAATRLLVLATNRGESSLGAGEGGEGSLDAKQRNEIAKSRFEYVRRSRDSLP